MKYKLILIRRTFEKTLEITIQTHYSEYLHSASDSLTPDRFNWLMALAANAIDQSASVFELPAAIFYKCEGIPSDIKYQLRYLFWLLESLSQSEVFRPPPQLLQNDFDEDFPNPNMSDGYWNNFITNKSKGRPTLRLVFST